MSDTRGSVAISFAVALLAILMAAGAALDLNRLSTAENDAQQALDVATLAVAATVDSDPDTLGSAYAEANFDTAALNGAEPTFTGDDDRVIGTVTVEVPSTFAGIAGLDALSVTVRSEATRKRKEILTGASFQPTNAQGAFDKEIYLVLYDENGEVTSRERVLLYDYELVTTTSCSWWRCTTSTSGRSTTTPPLNTFQTMTVPSHYDHAFEMVAYQDRTWAGRRINPFSMLSNEADTSTFLRRSGDCEQVGGESIQWEDGGDTNFRDFVYTMTCTKEVRMVGSPRLSR